MLRLALKAHWLLLKNAQAHALPRVIELLRAIEDEGSVSAAAKRLRVSYRHAWGLLRTATRDFGAPLVQMSRGKSARLSSLGAKLVAADRRINARIAPLLDSLASELEAEIERCRPGAASLIKVQASHGYAIEALRDFLVRRHVPIDLRYRGSMEALAALAAGDCDLAAFHAPIGELQGQVLPFYRKWLDPARQALISLSTRRQGIMTAAGNPKGVYALADLLKPEVRLVNRQFGSGTRILLDLLLKRELLDSDRISGYDSGEFTHSGVAACVASGLADAGFGVETGAREFGLEFIPIASERYYFVCAREALDSPVVRKMRDAMQSKQFRAEAARLPGIDVTEAGSVLSLREAFPELERIAAQAAGAAGPVAR